MNRARFGSTSLSDFPGSLRGSVRDFPESLRGSVRLAGRKAQYFSNGTRRVLREIRALLVFLTVLLVGAAIFSALERDQEVLDRAALADFLKRMNATLTQPEFHEMVAFMGKEDRVAEEMLRSDSGDPALAPHDWDFVGACFFCFTAATTIGYGNYTPRTNGGKAFLIFYALVAIPACLTAFSEVSDRALEMLARRFRDRHVFDKRIEQVFVYFDLDRSGKLDRSEVRNAMRVLGYSIDASPELFAKFDEGFSRSDADGDGELDTLEFKSFVLTIAPDASVRVEQVLSKGYVVVFAFLIFVVVVAFSTLCFSAFYQAEDWTVLDAFYFTVVSFTTIGFGDFSPDPHPGWFAAVFILTTFFGLGITATLARAASDRAFSLSSLLRGLSPRKFDRLAQWGERLGYAAQSRIQALRGRAQRPSRPAFVEYAGSIDSTPSCSTAHGASRSAEGGEAGARRAAAPPHAHGTSCLRSANDLAGQGGDDHS